MKVICDGCGHDWEMSDKNVAGLYPPKGAVRLMARGCERCVDGPICGWFCWRMEDGTLRGALAGEDDLKEQGVAVFRASQF